MSETTFPPELAAIYDRLAQIGQRLNGKIAVGNRENKIVDRNSSSLDDECAENKQFLQGGESNG